MFKIKSLNKEDLLKINGGGVSAWAVFGIGAALVFIAGVIDGFVRPLACNK